MASLHITAGVDERRCLGLVERQRLAHVSLVGPALPLHSLSALCSARERGDMLVGADRRG